jgi:hypothetical protein
MVANWTRGDVATGTVGIFKGTRAEAGVFFDKEGTNITCASLFLYETAPTVFGLIKRISFCKKSTVAPPVMPPPPIAGVIVALGTSGNND